MGNAFSRDYSRRCVVCGEPVDDASAVYANAWEASLGERPCCGAACKARFDADVHWMPAEEPMASQEEAARLAGVAKGNVRRGDDRTTVARDLLCAGVPPSVVRHVLRIETAAASASEKRTDLAGLAGLAGLVGLLSGVWVTYTRAAADAERRKAALANAADTIAAWEKRFGSR